MSYCHFLGQDRSVSSKDRVTMPYTDAVLLEVLRKSNVVHSAAPHTLSEDIKVEGKVCGFMNLKDNCLFRSVFYSCCIVVV